MVDLKSRTSCRNFQSQSRKETCIMWSPITCPIVNNVSHGSRFAQCHHYSYFVFNFTRINLFCLTRLSTCSLNETKKKVERNLFIFSLFIFFQVERKHFVLILFHFFFNSETEPIFHFIFFG